MKHQIGLHHHDHSLVFCEGEALEINKKTASADEESLNFLNEFEGFFSIFLGQSKEKALHHTEKNSMKGTNLCKQVKLERKCKMEAKDKK